MTLSVTVIGGMFAVTYLPQLAVLVLVNGPLAVVSTVLLVLNESSTIINIVSRNWILQDALLDTFDGTLVSRNRAAMVSEGRELKSGGDPMQRLGKILKSPFERLGPKAIVRYLMYLPLNFIPVVGTVMFIFFQGERRLLPARLRTYADRSFRTEPWPTCSRSGKLASIRLHPTTSAANSAPVLSAQEVVIIPALGLAREARRTVHSVRQTLPVPRLRSPVVA